MRMQSINYLFNILMYCNSISLSIRNIYFPDREEFITYQLSKGIEELHRDDVVIYNGQTSLYKTIEAYERFKVSAKAPRTIHNDQYINIFKKEK